MRIRRAIFVIFLLMVSFFLGSTTTKLTIKQDAKIVKNDSVIDIQDIQEQVTPKTGYLLPVIISDLGKRMVDDGVIDVGKLARSVNGKETLPDNLKGYLDGSYSGPLELNSETTHFLLNVFWALGLANSNPILDSSQMASSTAQFASTGGYTLGREEAMVYYNKFYYINLSDKQQSEVKELADTIYRPCCGNATSFPDCNHGMAMLGLLELMVAKGFSKQEIYKTALQFNSYWFPQTYYTIAFHFAKSGRSYKTVPAKEILAKTFSSAMGYQAVKNKVGGDVVWPQTGEGSGCTASNAVATA